MPSIAELHGKGEIWQLFDRFFSRSDPQARLTRKAQVLAFLHTNQRFTSFPYQPSSLTPDQVEGLKSHIDTDWFGGTGWQSWGGGETEGIVRETVIRALEVSLGLPHHRSTQERPIAFEDYGLGPPDEPAEPPRNWPIEFWTVSGVPYFAASLTWRQDRDEPQRGLVIVTWLTPGEATSLAGAGEADLDPTDATGWTGSWIIRHEVNEVSSPTRATSAGAIVTVSPAAENGGVNAELEY
jgi:hypothetical protein